MDTDGVTRVFATDKRDKKPVEMCTNAILLNQDCKRLTKSLSSGPYILLAHAIELLLKAYLHKQGESLDDLRKSYGHDLVELLKDARGRGLTVSDPEADNFIYRLNTALEKAALRYEFYFSDLPMVDRLAKFSETLAKDVKQTLE